jgi:MFS family permease
MTGLLAGIVGQLLLPATDPAGFRPFCIVAIILAFALVPIALTQAVAPTQEGGGARISLKRLYQQSPFGLVAASLCGVTTSAFFALGPILAQRLGLDTRGVAVLMASGTLGGFLLAWPIGWLSDRFDRRFVIIATALTATAALVTIIALVPDEPSRWLLYLCAAILGGTIVPTYSVVMAYVNDAVGEGEFVAASGGLLIVQGVGATAGPLIGGVAMSAWDHGLAYTLIAAQILLAIFGVYRSTRRAAPRKMDKGRFVVEPFIQVGTSLESRTGQSGRISR